MDRQTVDSVRVGTDLLTFRLTSAATAGALVAADVALPPGGGPHVLHRHDPEELYRVERGTLTFYVEDRDGSVRRTEASAGTVVHLPAGRAHTVRNESGAEALGYVVFSPGAAMERFVRAAGALPASGAPPLDAVLALAEEHGIEMGAPVPAPW
jgi:oxalate decarboxylase/phosphoglucose isomerase-like protein (cupin superfamily)